MYVENDALFTFTKIGQGASKKLFPPCYYHFRLMQIYFNASALHLLYIISSISHATHLQIYSGNIFRSFHVVTPWFSMVSDGSPWLTLVIPGYPWLYLVIYNSNICEIVCAFAIILSVICRNFLLSRPDKMTMR